MASSLFFSLIILSLLPLFPSLSPDAILDASEILKDSGFSSMALTLELASPSLLHHPSSLTIFSPTDSAFSLSGQPPLSLLQYHLLPHAFSSQSLRSLPSGAKLSTTLPGRFLTVTNVDDQISLNGVTVDQPPLYDDGSLIIFGIEKFFNPFFERPGEKSNRIIRPDLECRESSIQSDSFVALAAAALRNRGWSVMASFLDLQFLGFHKQPTMTIFAPTDDALTNRVGNISDWRSIFRRHVVPCKIRWWDLADFSDGTEIRTYLGGYSINVNRTGGVLTVNDVSVIFPDLFYSDGIVVHGIGGVLEIQKEMEEDQVESSSEMVLESGISPAFGFNVSDSDRNNGVAHYHFSVFR